MIFMVFYNQKRRSFVTRLIYRFGAGVADGDRSMRAILGGKGANLAEMAKLGIPVPPGYTISTDVWRIWSQGEILSRHVKLEIGGSIDWLQGVTGREIGGLDPLLVSVRSGAAQSMPGMMDTVLNVGLNDALVESMAAATDNRRLAFDCYRRLLEMFGEVVAGIDPKRYEKILEALLQREGLTTIGGLTTVHLEELCGLFKQVFEDEIGEPFPQDPYEQLDRATEAVFASWNNEQAIAYRKIRGIPNSLGTAVSVQTMVYGNRSDASGTIVAFTANTATGERKLSGQYLTNAQGEDVVDGRHDARDVADLYDEHPQIAEEFETFANRLERHFCWPQDIEATFEDGVLYLLQTRDVKPTARAAVRIAASVVEEGLLTSVQALLKLDAETLEHIFYARVDTSIASPIARGKQGSPGAVSGEVVFSVERAIERAQEGANVLLVVPKTDPKDFPGMVQSVGFITKKGGEGAHAIVVGRQLGKPAVVSLQSLEFNRSGVFLEGKPLVEGDILTIDGISGEVFAGEAPLLEPEPEPMLDVVLTWADSERSLGIRANADTPQEAIAALENGAEGIGLCRTEHMFRTEERLEAFQTMILAKDEETRRNALDQLMPLQRDDFVEIFRVMDGRPVTIRLLDPPLREFLPEPDEILERIKHSDDADDWARGSQMLERIEELSEANAMLGTRGARLLLMYPEIVEMQARAVFEAAIIATREGVTTRPEIMVPMVFDAEEFLAVRDIVTATYETVCLEFNEAVEYQLGTMIEISGACFVADELVLAGAAFLSFGTNDLTQFALGLSRDDTATLVDLYIERGIFERSPWVSIDQKRVGELMRIAIERARSIDADIKIGICGEHGGDPRSIELCFKLGLDYVSASSARLPTARLAAAQAALRADEEQV